jgi:phosphohistidine phosphatase
MLLYLVRHGIAVDRAPQGGTRGTSRAESRAEAPAGHNIMTDAERPLTLRGRKRARAAAEGLRALGAKPDAMLSSPLVRAEQTAKLFAQAFDFPGDDIRLTDALKSSSVPADLLREIGKLGANEVMCFGHEPHLSHVIAYILHSRNTGTELRRAGVACFELKTLSPPSGLLVGLYPAKALRMMGK